MISILDDNLKMMGQYVRFILGMLRIFTSVYLSPNGGKRSPMIGHHMWRSSYRR